MKVILVRHGQTGENVAHRHQPTMTPLSVAGRRQAVVAGERLQQFHPSHVVTSPVVRAVQTASLISNELDLIPSIDHNLRELERPRSMTSHRHFSLWSLWFHAFWFLGLVFSGESYRNLRQRAYKVRAHLQQLPDDAVVVVVSHTVFINLFLAHLHRSWPLWPWQVAIVSRQIIRFKNTAMVELTYEEGEWRRTNDLNLS